MAKQRGFTALIRTSARVTAVTGVGVIGAGVLGVAPAVAAPAFPLRLRRARPRSTARAERRAGGAIESDHLNRVIDASGCDIGIYVGAGVSHVTIAVSESAGRMIRGSLQRTPRI